MADPIGPGQTRVGFLVDGDATTGHQACALSYEEGSGPILSVPFISGQPEFAHGEKWFHERQPPSSVTFCDDSGFVTLSGLSWRGHRGLTYVTGRLSPRITYYERPRALKRAYKIREFRSSIDGLRQFTGTRAVDVAVPGPGSRDENVRVTLQGPEVFRWRHGGYTHRIRAGAWWSGSFGEFFEASTRAQIESTKYKGDDPDDFLAAQWPMRALLVLVFGLPLYWRGHSIKDDQFPMWMLDGSTREAMAVDVQLRRTSRDLEQPPVSASELSSPMFTIADIGTAGLARWYRLYDDEIIRRAIEPAVELINGAARFLEPQLMLAAVSLEAMGHYRDSKRRRNRPLHEQVLRCIDATGADLSEIGENACIAKAIADTYNDLKHPDRPERPAGVALALLTDLSILLMRLQIMDLLEVPEELRTQIRARTLWRVVDRFKGNGVRVDENGRVMRSD